MLIDGLMPRLSALKAAMTAGAVTLDTLPPEIKSDWIAADGTARVAIFPSGDDNNSENLAKFVAALRTVAPDVTGRPCRSTNPAARFPTPSARQH